jgi:hypothetical protein
VAAERRLREVGRELAPQRAVGREQLRLLACRAGLGRLCQPTLAGAGCAVLPSSRS